MARHPATDPMITTLLVTNIHCPSCVSYATDVLSPYSDSIQSLSISIIDHIIRIRHTGDISDKLAQELVRASFEVQHVTLSGASGNVVRDYDVQHADTTLPEGFFETLFMSKAQKRHIQTCSACQEVRKQTGRRKTTWADVLRMSRTRRPRTPSVEDGVIREKSPSSDSQATAHIMDHTGIENAKDETYTAVFSVEGMTCASCVSAITNELNQQDYIVSASVNLVANSASVVFRGSRATVNEIKDTIEDIGYGAELEQLQPVDKESENTDLYKASLSIDGMTCGSCVGTVTRGVKELSFVQSVDVDLVSNSGMVIFQGRQNLDAILEAIEDIGYDASVVSVEEVGSVDQTHQNKERSVQIQISGMYCQNCPSSVMTAIDKAFPHDVTVTQKATLKNPRLTILYLPSVPKLTIRRILEVVDSADPEISASVYHPPSLEQRSQAIRKKERNRILRHLLVALLVAIPSFVIGVVYMDLVPADNSTRQWFEEPIWAGSAMRNDWALFIMTTPAMFYAASIFHIRALKEIWSLWRPRSKVPILRRFYRFGSMNLLVSAGTAVAYFASLAVLCMDATTPRQEQGTTRTSTTYFDTVTFLTLFILIGRFMEAYSKAKTGDAVSMLADLRPSTALLVDSGMSDIEGNDRPIVRQISVDLLEVGDIVSVPHGVCPPTDGIIAQDGNFLFDESSLTGESRPVRKARNDKVFTGSLNTGDPVRVEVTEIGGKSMLDQIVNVVREGQAKRAPIERLADTLTGYFTPVITLLAISTWIIWLALGESGRLPQGWLDVPRGGWPYWTVEFAIAVFVVACPCGIGLAAPTALFVGGGLAAKNGILVQGGGDAFQEASRLDAIVFDKTGTLTEGRMRVTDVEFLDTQKELPNLAVFAIAKALEEASTHPIAKAIVQRCDSELKEESGPSMKVLNIKEIPGHGMSGTFELEIGSEIRTYEAAIGNERLLNNIEPMDSTIDPKETDSKGPKISTPNIFLSSTLSRFQSLGNTTAIFAIRSTSPVQNHKPQQYKPTAIFAITDPIRPEAFETLASIRNLGLSIYMCTGDNQQTAHSVAAQLLIPVSHVRAAALPQDKATFIQSLQNPDPSTRKVIAFIGDGTNDTPALTVSDVSIAVSHPSSGGSDIAISSSSFILLNNNLVSILTLVKLSRRVFLRVKLNFLWAFVYNVCLIPVAAGVFFPVGATWDASNNGMNATGGFRLSPVWASVAMAGSSVSVVLSSLALRLPEVEFHSGSKSPVALVKTWFGRRE